MSETSQVLVIVHANDLDRYENLARIHAGDGRVRVIFDRRRELGSRNKVTTVTTAEDAEPEARPPDRRSRGAQHWQDGQLVIETGYS